MTTTAADQSIPVHSVYGVAQADPRFDRIAREYGARLARLAMSYVDEADRDDLMQEILLALWRALPAFRGEASERTFVLRVAMNRAATYRARRYRRREVPVGDALRDGAPSPDTRVEQIDERDRLFDAVRALPLHLRDTVFLYLEDLGVSEIAELQGISANNVRVRLTRARHQLRQMLERDS